MLWGEEGWDKGLAGSGLSNAPGLCILGGMGASEGSSQGKDPSSCAPWRVHPGHLGGAAGGDTLGAGGGRGVGSGKSVGPTGRCGKQ